LIEKAWRAQQKQEEPETERTSDASLEEKVSEDQGTRSMDHDVKRITGIAVTRVEEAGS